MSNSLAQDIEAGDGTTSVVVIAGALLGAAERLFGSSENCCAAGTVGPTDGDFSREFSRHPFNRD